MNILLIKQVAIISAILGAAGGLVALIPAFTLLMLLSAFIFPAIIVLTYMKQNELIGIINTKEGCILGGIIGFISFFASFIAYAPISIVIAWILKLIFGINYIPGFLRLIPLDILSIIVLLLTVIFLAGICAVFNAATGLATIWAYELITGIKQEKIQESSVDFEIK